MLAVIAELQVKEGSEAEFEGIMLDLAAAVRANESGNQIYELTRPTEGSGAYLVMELYTDEQALSAHRQTEHFRASSAKLGPLLAGRPVIKIHKVLR